MTSNPTSQPLDLSPDALLPQLKGAPLSVLLALAAGGEQSCRRLAEGTGWHHGTVREALDELEARALAQRIGFSAWELCPGVDVGALLNLGAAPAAAAPAAAKGDGKGDGQHDGAADEGERGSGSRASIRKDGFDELWLQLTSQAARGHEPRLPDAASDLMARWQWWRAREGALRAELEAWRDDAEAMEAWIKEHLPAVDGGQAPEAEAPVRPARTLAAEAEVRPAGRLAGEVYAQAAEKAQVRAGRRLAAEAEVRSGRMLRAESYPQSAPETQVRSARSLPPEANVRSGHTSPPPDMRSERMPATQMPFQHVPDAHDGVGVGVYKQDDFVENQKNQHQTTNNQPLLDELSRLNPPFLNAAAWLETVPAELVAAWLRYLANLDGATRRQIRNEAAFLRAKIAAGEAPPQTWRGPANKPRHAPCPVCGKPYFDAYGVCLVCAGVVTV